MSERETNDDGVDRAPETAHAWGGLVVLLAGTLLSPLDFFIVNTSLPSIRAELGADTASVQLVVAGYACAYAILLVTGGRLGDIYGRRRMFLVGLGGFALASLGCGLAPTADALVVGRIVQGGFAAILMPQSLATIRATFPAAQRAKALALYAATFGIAAILGQLLGGALIALDAFHTGWRSIFLVNVPVACIVAPLARRLVSETRDSKSATRPDVVGLVLLGSGLAAVVVPLSEGREQGWPSWTIALLTVAAPVFWAFWRYETRLEAAGADPLCPPKALRAPGLPRALAATLLYYAWGAYFLLFAIYQQNGLHRTPLDAGLAILPFGVGFAVTSLLSARISAAIGRQTPAVSMVLIAVALFASAAAALLGLGWATSAIGLVAGVGQGFGLPSLVRTVMDRMDERLAGLGAGLVNSTLQVGGAFSVTIFAGLYYATIGDSSDSAAVATAFAEALLGMGLVLLLAAWLIGGVSDPDSECAGVPAPDAACACPDPRA